MPAVRPTVTTASSVTLDGRLLDWGQPIEQRALSAVGGASALCNDDGPGVVLTGADTLWPFPGNPVWPAGVARPPAAVTVPKGEDGAFVRAWSASTRAVGPNERSGTSRLGLGARPHAPNAPTEERTTSPSAYRGAIGGQSAGSVTTRIGDPARYAVTSSAMRCQALRKPSSVT